MQEKLKDAVLQAEKIAGKNLSLPILSCILLEAEKNHLIVRANNLDLGFKKTIPAKVEEAGMTAVSGAVLSALIGGMGNEKGIKLSADEHVLSVKSSKNRATIKSLPHEDFPTIPPAPEGKSFSVEGSDLVRGIRSVSYSSSVGSVKPELSSVYLRKDDAGLVFAATDSFRLAEKRVRFGNGAADIEPMLIPFKNTSEIVRVLESAEGLVHVYTSKHQVSFVFGETYLTSRLLEGSFPDYREIIPKEAKTEVVLLKADLAESLKLANIFSDSFNQVSFSVKPKEKRFEITARNNSVGENSTEVPAALEGEETEANFNYRYIADCLQSIPSDSVSLSFAGAAKPMVVRGVSDKSFTYLVMPMNR